MTSRINHVTFDCADSYQLAGFWSQVLGRPMHDDDHPGDPEAILVGEPNVLFIVVPEGNPDEPRTGFTYLSAL